MSKLEELINKLCPDGVEYKKMSEVSEISIGEFVHKNKQHENAKYPVYNGGTSNTGYYDEFNRTENKIIISARGANAGYVNRVFTKFWSGNSCYTVGVNEHFLNWTFAYYWLKSKEVSLLGKQQKAGIPAVSKKQVEDFPIPLPPLPVQEEIVRILDNITSLTAELTAELKARQKQYEYYRDSLLRFNEDNAQEGVRWMKLGEVVNIKNGKDYKCFAEGKVPVYGTGGVMAYIDTFAYDKPSVLIPRKGSLDKLYYVDVPFWTVDTIFYTDIDTALVIPKYVFYYLQTQHLEKLNTAGGVPSLTQTVLNKVPIPIPPIEEQQRIVDILDRFDKLCNDISEGLPAEIEARKKQYEYYRDKLLTFKEKEG